VRVPSPAGIGPRLNLFVRVLPALPALLLAGTARAWDPFDDAESPSHFELVDGDMKLALKGELSLTFHDLEGEGGPGNDSNTDTRTIGTRSPFIELSGFTLAPRLTLTPGLSVNTELRFTPEDAQVAATWFDGRAETGDFEHHVEIGFRPPLANRDPHATREPLAATAWWSAPEMHAAYEAGQKFGEDDDFAWSAGVSAAMGRPLGFAPVQASHAQRGTINLLAYDAGRVYSGNAPMYGARARFQAFGAYVEAFGFLGELADESGTDQLRASLAGYPSLPDGEQSNHTSRWGGGRVGYDGHGAHVVVEGVYGAEGALAPLRRGRRAGLAFRPARRRLVHGRRAHRAGGRVSHPGQHPGPRRPSAAFPALSQAATWDWTLYTAGVAVPVFRDLLRLRLEYDVVTEANDVPALNESGLDFRNDELRAELRLRF
jgi:hypothetical protein